jgi:hypothetical protein
MPVFIIERNDFGKYHLLSFSLKIIFPANPLYQAENCGEKN